MRISDLQHKAVLTVDEEGAEAASATFIGFVPLSGIIQPATVTIDRPFLIFIRSKQTGLVLFSGKVVNPPPI